MRRVATALIVLLLVAGCGGKSKSEKTHDQLMKMGQAEKQVGTLADQSTHLGRCITYGYDPETGQPCG